MSSSKYTDDLSLRILSQILLRLVKHCRQSGFGTHFPPQTSSAHHINCLLSAPCTAVKSFRRIHVEILLRSDLTRVALLELYYLT